MTKAKRWIRILDGTDLPSRELIGGKAWSVARIRSLGLVVPPAFVITTAAHAAFLSGGGLPDGLEQELADGLAWLESVTGRTFGYGSRPLLVSVRSGAAVSMPGMMETVLNLGITDQTEAALAEEFANSVFARDTHRRFLQLYTRIVLKSELPNFLPDERPEQWRRAIRAAINREVPESVMEQLYSAIQAVFESWNSRRAKKYRDHHGISHSLGTAVTVQAMVFGNLDVHSGTGVLFSRNPLTGEAKPFGEYLQGAQGEDVVSGMFTPKPLSAMADSVPQAYERLLEAAMVLERAGRAVQDVEFTVEKSRLYLLQARSAKLAPQAAVRAAVSMVREGLIGEKEALGRIAPDRIRILMAPRLDITAAKSATLLAKGEGACPGVGIGVVVTDADEAECLAADGSAVVLARPNTSPNDVHGMIASVAVITEEGGSTSHAAVVSRALGIPCVVGCGAGRLQMYKNSTVTVDGQTGQIFDGRLDIVVPDERSDDDLVSLAAWAQAVSPLRVLREADAPAEGLVDLTNMDGAEDAQKIPSILAQLGRVRGARGGAIATDLGVRAAIAAGLDFIVAEPVLPALLAAAQAKL
jgi:pyruvate,orthophosphate dikinase